MNKVQIWANEFLAHIWNSTLYNNKGEVIWNVENDILNLPKYLDYKSLYFNSKLSARLKSSIVTQVSGIIRGSVGIKRNLIAKAIILESKGINTDKLRKKINNIKITKPNLNNFKLEISSKNCDIKEDKNFFDMFIRIKCLSIVKDICIPIKLNKMDKKWINKGAKRLASICISKNSISLRYEYDVPIRKDDSTPVGVDTGINTIATFSDTQKTPNTNHHGKTFDSIIKKINRKKKGSELYTKALIERDNFIKESINKIDFTKFSKLNIEKVFNFGYKTRTSEYVRRWTPSQIHKKIESRAEEFGVQISQHGTPYYSQRCSECGYVHKKNRKLKKFECMHCGLKIDSDLNAAMNHVVELPKLEWKFMQGQPNKVGFFWNLPSLEGLGQESESLIAKI
jgi:transposase